MPALHQQSERPPLPLIQVLNKEVQLATLKQNIQMRTREDLDRQQREYFLQQQIKNIQDELGNGQNDEVEELREKASHKKWRREVGETFEKEVSKLERINPQSPDYNVQRLTFRLCWHFRGMFIRTMSSTYPMPKRC